MAKRRKKAKKQRLIIPQPSLATTLKISVAVCIIAAIVVGFIFLDKYVKKAIPLSEKKAFLDFVDAPEWANETLRRKIYAAARTYGEDLKIDENVALSVQQNLQALVSWLDEIKVQTTHDHLIVKAKWRKPLALVKAGLRTFYVDNELVILDFVPMPELPIVKIDGLPVTTQLPPSPGGIWNRNDLAAAIAILAKLDQMDASITPDKPLLYEIKSIDVSNFNGRQHTQFPHITLYAKDRTEIVWGAELDTWQRHLEATDEEKIAKLYSYYEEHGSLSGGAKFINLRDPQKNIPQPVDKY
ncbi:MAG: hypothetical protein KAS75_01460 [Planctomycetes bacterium]|nr:hypothetical protein [Planctomycetota bacterium]